MPIGNSADTQAPPLVYDQFHVHRLRELEKDKEFTKVLSKKQVKQRKNLTLVGICKLDEALQGVLVLPFYNDNRLLEY